MVNEVNDLNWTKNWSAARFASIINVRRQLRGAVVAADEP